MIRDIIRSPLLDGIANPLGTFLPSDLANLKLWTRYNQGITETGLGVSQWNDVSGNGNHLKQGTDANRPSKEADGSVLFDGIAHFLKADAFTWDQPEEIFILLKQATWTSTDTFFDGNADLSCIVWQKSGGVSPELEFYAGTLVGTNSDLAINTYGVVSAAFNGASSILQIDNNSPLTGNAGASNMGGFTLGARGSGSNPSNIQAKEVIGYGVTLTTAQRAQIISYLLSI